jgi:hypothetical protein
MKSFSFHQEKMSKTTKKEGTDSIKTISSLIYDRKISNF